MPRVDEPEVSREEDVLPRLLVLLSNLFFEVLRRCRETVELVPDEHELPPIKHHVHGVHVEVVSLSDAVGLL